MKNFLFFVALCYSASLFAQAEGNYMQRQNYSNANLNIQYRSVPKAANIMDANVMEINVNALSNQKADSYTAIFNLMQLGKTAEETNTIMNTRLDGFIGELKALGLPESDIYIDMVNFLPKYEYDVSKKLFSNKTYTEIPKGFELQKNVHVRYTNPNMLDRIVTAAAKREIYDIVKVDYFVKEPQVHYTKLREEAFKYLLQIKKQYLGFGIKLDSAYVITGENAWVAYPINRYESYKAFSSQHLDNDEKMNATIKNAEKATARFYNAVAANVRYCHQS